MRYETNQRVADEVMLLVAAICVCALLIFVFLWARRRGRYGPADISPHVIFIMATILMIANIIYCLVFTLRAVNLAVIMLAIGDKEGLLVMIGSLHPSILIAGLLFIVIGTAYVVGLLLSLLGKQSRAREASKAGSSQCTGTTSDN